MNSKATGGVLLLVEDDDSIGRLVKAYLEQQDGWRVVWLRTGEEAIAELRRHPVRLVVLDIGLPGIDGFEVCRRLRAQSRVPIVMLTARIKAILRRAEQRSEDAVLTARGLVLRRDSRDVTSAGAPIELTSKEFDLL